MRYEYDNTDFKSTEYHYGQCLDEVTFRHQCGFYRVRVKQGTRYTYDVCVVSRDRALALYHAKQREHRAKLDEYMDTEAAYEV